MKSTAADQNTLLTWYHANKRDLPWRKSRDPYRIWISETMLQQTTTTAVIPYFERFLKKFPTLQSLAKADLTEVIELWAGLGYYTRARNLHKAAVALALKKTFPKIHTELLELPGFGPYTARAVSSIAFSESVGVLDGNVIRVMSRKGDLNIQWWRPRERQVLQDTVDKFVKNGPSHELNQALMELGAQICTAKNPHCIQCPWIKSCAARKNKTISLRPLKKPKKKRQFWLWSPTVLLHNNHVNLVKNTSAPFLKGQWLLPSEAKQLKEKPKKFDFRHSITHHDIYVQVVVKRVLVRKKWTTERPSAKWVLVNEVRRLAPASLITKAIKHALQNDS